MYGMTLIAEDPTQAFNPLVWGLFVVSLGLAVAFVRHVRRTPNPVMEYALLARNPFLAANIYAFLFGAVRMGFYSFIPYYAVVRYGMSPFESGAILTPRARRRGHSVLASVYLLRLGYRCRCCSACPGRHDPRALSMGWTTLQIGGVSLQGFWLCRRSSRLAASAWACPPGVEQRRARPGPDKAAAMTGIRGTFR